MTNQRVCANNETVSTPANRRQVLKGAVVTALATTSIFPRTLDARPAALDPVPPLLAKYKRIVAYMSETDIEDDDASWDRVIEVRDQIAKTDATTLEGVLAKLELAELESAEFSDSDPFGKRLFKSIEAGLRNFS